MMIIIKLFIAKIQKKTDLDEKIFVYLHLLKV